MAATSPKPPETILWQGTPSPLLNLPTFLGLGLAAVAATAGLLWLRGAAGGGLEGWIPGLIAGAWALSVLVALWAHVVLRSTRYQVTSERLRITTGLLSTRTEDLELRRVRDSSVERPFLLRLAGLGNVHLTTADPSSPTVLLRAVPDPDGLQATIRGAMHEMMARYGVREIEVM